MTTIRDAAANVPAEIVLNLRRPVLIASTVGVLAVVGCAFAGHIVMGILFVVGLGLGLLNTRMLQRSVVKVIASENPSKKAIGVESVKRLAFITVIAVGLGIFLRPDGLGVFLGLAIFQVIIVACTVIPVMRERRASE